MALAWTALAVTSIVARLGPLRMLRGSLVALPFALAALPLIVTRGGEPIGSVDLKLFTLTASGEGLRLFATVLVKSWVSVQAAVLLTSTTTFHDLVDGLRALRLPRLMVAVIALMYRYLGVLTGEASRMLRARAARSAVIGHRGGGSTVWRAKVVGGMVGALFIRSYERSERVYAAMQARGFDGEFRALRGRKFDTGDWVALGLPLAALVCFEAGSHAWLPRL